MSTDHQIEQEIQDKGKTAARVTPVAIEAAIASEHYFTAEDGAGRASRGQTSDRGKNPVALSLLTFCVLVLRNGFTVTGESACASPENFDAEIGRKIARANAVQKIWPLEGYLLKQRLHDEASAGDLQAQVVAAERALAQKRLDLEAHDGAVENNIFDTLEDAESTLEERLLDKARGDCEGSHNCGNDKYTQQFQVGCKQYLATLTVEYNRHDKTYYYIDGSDFSVAAVEG